MGISYWIIMNNIYYYLGFSYFDGIGPMTLQALIAKFGDVKKAYEAEEGSLRNILPAKLAEKFITFRSAFDPVNELHLLKERAIHVVFWEDKKYPLQLKNLSDPPICLYMKGKISLLCDLAVAHFVTRESPPEPYGSGYSKVKNFSPSLQTEYFNNSPKFFFAIVGTRNPTPYGQQIAKKFSNELAQAGFTIVSGMAMGIDTIAHRGALEVGGKTIAVLGCGVEVIYPAVNQRLYWDIIETGGLVISEFPPKQFVEKGLFVARNRIISGLSQGVLIIEGLKDSGALITARYAAEQGKEVFAAPGPITSPLSQAPHLLLKQGAKLVTSVEDIYEELGLRLLPKKKENIETQLDMHERKIFQALQKEPLRIDDVAQQIRQPVQQVLDTLSLLELKGIIEKNTEGKYQLKW